MFKDKENSRHVREVKQRKEERRPKTERGGERRGARETWKDRRKGWEKTDRGRERKGEGEKEGEVIIKTFCMHIFMSADALTD